jgi:hypothetical protein
VRPSEARSTLAGRRQEREHAFLRLVRDGVYEGGASPYRDLFRWCGCQYGDLERLVRRDGVEGALRALFREGVYLTVDELKGRRPVVRGEHRLVVEPGALRNPRATRDIPLQSSGSTGARTTLAMDWRFLRETNVDHALVMEARKGDAWVHAGWGVPGGAELYRILKSLGIGGVLGGWFRQIEPRAGGLPLGYAASAWMLRAGAALAGVRLPSPIAAPLDDPLPVVHWMAAVLRQGRTPHLMTFASAALRVCEAAGHAGIEIAGAELTLGGEPTTRARLEAVAAAGAVARPQYAASELSVVLATGCLAPSAPDDMHFLEDLAAVIQPGPDATGGDVPADGLLLSSLRPLSPLVVLNGWLGDRGVVEERTCGCALEAVGWRSHVRGVRSHRRLSAGGMTLLDEDAARVLEEVLPASLGGEPWHYQLIEDETAAGHPSLRLIVDPAVGEVDAARATAVFLRAIGVQPDGRLPALHWAQAGFIRVERTIPERTVGGKVPTIRRRTGAGRPPMAEVTLDGDRRAER